MIVFRNISGHPLVTVAEALGIVPSFLDEDDPRPAREQIHERYAHGGGWDPLPRYKFNPENQCIKYPGDPWMKPYAYAVLHGREAIYCYDAGWFAIVQIDTGAFEVARLD